MGTNSWSIDLAWDELLQDSLELVAAIPVTSFVRGFANPTPPPETIGYTALGLEEVRESSASVTGKIDQITGAVTQDFNLTIANTSFRAGTVTFSVSKMDSTDIVLGFFRSDGAVMGSGASQFITPNFGSFAMVVPEPNGALLAIASLSSVAFLASRRRRSD